MRDLHASTSSVGHLAMAARQWQCTTREQGEECGRHCTLEWTVDL